MAYSNVPVWQPNNEATECALCHSQFSLWFRKHHCRMCGRIVCGSCSPTYEKYLATSYVVTPPNEQFLQSPHIPHRTCTECADELWMIRTALESPVSQPRTSNRPVAPSSGQPPLTAEARALLVQNVVPGIDNDYLGRCPVCDKPLFRLPQTEQEIHIDDCLKTYSSSPAGVVAGPQQRKRMLISRLPQKEGTALGDCTICYEEFEPGQNIGRLECLCVFHEKCIFEWFSRKGVGSCPLHNQGD